MALLLSVAFSPGAVPHARLLAPPELLGALPAAEADLATLSRAELEAERERVFASRRRVGGHVALAIIGGVGTVTGIAFVLMTLEYSTLLAVSVAVTIISGAAAALGVVLAVMAAAANTARARRLEAIDAQLGLPSPPEPNEVPPPPPARPTGLPVVPPPQLLIATF